MLKTEPVKRRTLTLCRIIEKTNTTIENKQLKNHLKNLVSDWDRRDNIETVS